MFEILKEKDIEILSRGVLDVLEKLGFLCENTEILKAWEKAGAKVDYDKQTARFPRKLIQEFVNDIKKEDKSNWGEQLHLENKDVIYSGYHPYEQQLNFKAPNKPYFFHNLSTYYYDDEKKERRLGNRPDFIDLIKFGDELHPDEGVGHALILSDMPSEIEPLEAALTLLEYSHNPRGVYVLDIRQIDYLIEIEDIMGIDDPYWHWMANICCNSPLKLDKTVAERYVYMVKTGIHPAKLAGMPVSGVNLPITTSGTVVVMSAEFIALWLAARLLQTKKIPLTGTPYCGTMNMHSGNISFTAFDTLINRLSICDFIKKWTGIQLSPGPGEYSPTKIPGSYCALEKAYAAMIFTAFTGFHPDLGIGHIDAGLTISPVQLLIEQELVRGLEFLNKPLISKEAIGLEAIMQTGFGLKEDFLGTDHTLNNFHSSSWMPEFFCRGEWTPENEKQVLEKALQKTKELIQQHKKPEGIEDMLIKARAVVERAKKEMTV